MVKHIILWKLKDELSAAEKVKVKAGIKAGLEGLKGVVPRRPHGRIGELQCGCHAGFDVYG